MEKTIKVNSQNRLIGLADEIVYWQKPYWCNATTRQLKLSLMKPRHYYPYDPLGTYPVLVFVCGGGFEKMSRNVWTPSLSYFAQHGYAVACVDYSVLPYTEFPEAVQDIKAAIRYLRAHAEEYSLNKDQFVIMGESAGGYFSSLCGLTNGDPAYDVGENLDQSSAVQACVPWYGPSALGFQGKNHSGKEPPRFHVRLDNFPNLLELVTGNAPPMCLLHGTSDYQVPWQQSKLLYDKLVEKGVDAELYLLEGAGHADRYFVEDEVMERMLKFMNRILGRTGPDWL